MLSKLRKDEHLYSVPKFDLKKSDFKDLMNELKGFHEQFADCFQRSESREHFFNYMVGQFSELERKSIEPIALAVKDGNVRAMQRFISRAPWDDDKIMTKYRSLVNDDLGGPDGALSSTKAASSKRAMTPSALPASTAAASAKWTTARWGFLPPTSPSTAMPDRQAAVYPRDLVLG